MEAPFFYKPCDYKQFATKNSGLGSQSAAVSIWYTVPSTGTSFVHYRVSLLLRLWLLLTTSCVQQLGSLFSICFHLFVTVNPKSILCQQVQAILVLVGVACPTKRTVGFPVWWNERAHWLEVSVNKLTNTFKRSCRNRGSAIDVRTILGLCAFHGLGRCGATNQLMLI